VKYLSKEDQQLLLKLLPPIYSSASPERFSLFLSSVSIIQSDTILCKSSSVNFSFSSLRSMFSSVQFADAIHSYQRLLGEGILDPSFSVDDEWDAVKRLVLTNLTKRKWLECYKQRKV
jgi:hypothetical protein